MNTHASVKSGAAIALVKADPNSPVFRLLGQAGLAIKAGVVFNGRTFDEETTLPTPQGGYQAGTDYAVHVSAETISVQALSAIPAGETLLGGFHFAPGGNATARSGGDETPQINPCSLWDINFRPACPDPRGMALVEVPGRKFWVDIYLLGANHITDGTSKHGVVIADGNDPPQKLDGNGYFDELDYETAVAVMKHHGKTLLGVEEFFAAAYGVTEKSAIGDDPERTKLDAARTSKFGLMQATGNLWAWGHDGDPDMPRASMFGGSWWNRARAGSRDASVASCGPADSGGNLGARGRGDHLQPV